MRKLILLLAALSFVGCNGIKRLTGQGDDPAPAPTQTLGGPPPISAAAPDFGIATPAGFQKLVFHAALPANGVVTVQANPGARFAVFINQRMIGQWFNLGTQYSGGFWYTPNATAGTVTINGDHLELIEYCVYEYVPEVL